MSDQQPLPVVRMQDDPGGASIVSYNVPEPTTYFGNMYFELDLDTLLADVDSVHTPTNTAMMRRRRRDWRRFFRAFSGLPFKGRDEAVALLRSRVHEGLIAQQIKRILDYGPAAAPASSADADELRLVAQFIYLPAGFEGLMKVWKNIHNELLNLTPAASQPRELGAPGTLEALAVSAQPAQPPLDYRRSLLFRRFQRLTSIDSWSAMEAKLREGQFLVVFRRLSGQYDYKFIPIPTTIRPRVFIMEKCRLSSFLGNYGAGRTIKTFSLLPGERMTITVKTFRKSTLEARAATSIVDSYSQEAAEDFEDSLSRERSRRTESQEQSAWHAEAEAEGSFLGFGGSAGGGRSEESTSQRENIATSVSDSVTKHSQRASAQREISIDTSYERKEESGEETSIAREVENINVSRTLNFVFRQMNQEYLTLLHLVDANIGYSSGLPGSLALDSVSNLDGFLSKVLDDRWAIGRIKEAIVDHLSMIVNYNGEKVPFLESEQFNIEHPLDPTRRLVANYIRVKRNVTDVYENAASGLKKKVPGIILSAQLNVMRTEGILVEALLGQGDGLDEYSHGLQEETVREKGVANDFTAKRIERMELGNSIVANNETEKAALFAKVNPCCVATWKKCGCHGASSEEAESGESGDTQ